MKKISAAIFGMSGALLVFSTDLAALPNSGNPSTFLGTLARVSVNDSLSDNTAFSLAGEVGKYDLRVDGTIGWQLINDQRLKLSAEYLFQNITYSYFFGNTGQWVPQGTVSADYQYDIDRYTYLFNPQIDVNAYYSHSPSKTFRVEKGAFTNSSGTVTTFSDDTRIAGANAAGISPGIILSPWQGGSAGISLNYDNVQYDTDYISSETVNGFGGTAHLIQALSDNVEVGVSAGIRAPFNQYDARLTWLEVPFMGTWSIGIDGAYTAGKNTLPSTYSVGVSFDYFIAPCQTSTSQREETYRFLSWVSAPAVYMPEVLGIPDDKVKKVP